VGENVRAQSGCTSHPAANQQRLDRISGTQRLQNTPCPEQGGSVKAPDIPASVCSNVIHTVSNTDAYGKTEQLNYRNLPELVRPPSSQIWPVESTVLEKSYRPVGWFDRACDRARSAKSNAGSKHTGTPRDPKLEPAAALVSVEPAILHAKTNSTEHAVKQVHVWPRLLVHHVQRRVPVSKVQTSLRLPAEGP
jgi:hypothetical protein